MFSIKTILNPRSFSEPSLRAHEIACDLARECKAKLIFLHVTDKPVVSYIERASELSSEELQRKLFETLRLPSETEAGLQVEHRVVEGDAVERILAVANETQCDLIVMGTEGATGISRWFTSSIAEEVILRSECSVMVAKARREPAMTLENDATV